MVFGTALEEYKKESFIKIGPSAIIVYWLLCFIDSHLANTHLLDFFLYRFLFSLPMIICIILVKLDKKVSLNILAIISMGFIFTGVSVISYQVSGIQSDYYFGIIIVSFLQFIFFPITIIQTILLDLYAMILYFGINSKHQHFELTLFYKQLSNFLSFVILKLIAVKTFNKMLHNNVRYVEIQKELKHKEKVQKLMGDLCHLLNNPMFVTQNYNERIIDSNSMEEIKEFADKSNLGINRMKKVTDEMLSIYQGHKEEIAPEIVDAGTI